jgi:membrane-associated phospholipid phosphatase
VRLAISRIGEKLPRGWSDVFRQLGLFVLADICYETVRGIADGQQGAAFLHGQQVIDLERSTHTFFEPSLQAFFLPAQWVIDFANQIYMNSQFAVTIAFLVWLYLFRNDAFYFVRNMFMAAMGVALIGYTLYPTAPPRLFPQYGFVDTITDFSNVNHDSALVKVFINPYAAVPSMHCAFALMIGVSGFRVSRHWFTRAFWAAWPLLVVWVVIVTANHYWVDAALGWMVAAAAAFIAFRLAKVRPELWAWRAGPREIEA